ncbi:MAG: tRNA (adenosine(37)-N6)-threonylcarbamoyltransferase complex transferase subunit TsaD [Planctomycetota bacterium]|nr:MAG: tRNA (adenosine(37)-N6)-threonylcarbamoyltransferase complex transferase subunit TsaD [Planctomycetota bacterium]
MHIVLGIESSCDETAAAILTEDGRRVLAEQVFSQAADFAAWGGVVPELAARAHVQHLPGIIAAVLQQAGLKPQQLNGIAVSAWPGLMGSLLCGVTCAKMLAARLDLPLIGVDHIAAHLSAAAIESQPLPYPAIGLVVSGGHSHFYHLDGPASMRLIGGTIDDAAGEAFDKAAAMLGLGYPGGPHIDTLAAQGNAKAFALPRSLLHSGDLRLSFAGLKTALLYAVRGPCGKEELKLDKQGICDAAASFQAAVVEVLCRKLLAACRQHGLRSVIVGGGVACNSGLRRGLQDLCQEHHLDLRLPRPQHCADNAAMIACLGIDLLAAGQCHNLDLSPLPTGAAGPRATPA